MTHSQITIWSFLSLQYLSGKILMILCTVRRLKTLLSTCLASRMQKRRDCDAVQKVHLKEPNGPSLVQVYGEMSSWIQWIFSL
ncbi:hypothetical protein B0H34DRAFT_702440, partial [Crassisporium funariophilum]